MFFMFSAFWVTFTDANIEDEKTKKYFLSSNQSHIITLDKKALNPLFYNRLRTYSYQYHIII